MLFFIVVKVDDKNDLVCLYCLKFNLVKSKIYLLSLFVEKLLIGELFFCFGYLIIYIGGIVFFVKGYVFGYKE